MTYLALGLAGPQLISLLDDPALVARWDTLPLAYTVLGIDRVDGREPASVTVDAGIAAAQLAARTAHARFLFAATPRRDHPYNLARRVASLGHLSAGRSGLLIGHADGFAVPGQPWLEVGSSGVDPVTPPGWDTVVADAAAAVRALEQSWPLESVVAQRERGVFVESGQINHVDVESTYRIAGPLTVPTPRTGPSVIARFENDHSAHTPAREPFDLVIGGTGDVAVTKPNALSNFDDVYLPGLVLSADNSTSVRDLLDEAADLFVAGACPVLPGPLRSALRLSEPSRTIGRQAFATPEPLRAS